MSLCEWCLALSPRFQAQRQCCQVRLLAGMPKANRLAAYERTRQAEGAGAEQLLTELVTAEYQRQRAQSTAVAKQNLEMLKKMTGARPR